VLLALQNNLLLTRSTPTPPKPSQGVGYLYRTTDPRQPTDDYADMLLAAGAITQSMWAALLVLEAPSER
jgi:hypothetical protein